MTESKYRLSDDTRSSGLLSKAGGSKIALSAGTGKQTHMLQGQWRQICGVPVNFIKKVHQYSSRFFDRKRVCMDSNHSIERACLVFATDLGSPEIDRVFMGTKEHPCHRGVCQLCL